MRTIVVQVDSNRYEVRERDESGAILGVFTTVHDAAFYQQAYSNGRY